MKAVWQGQVIAESDGAREVGGYVYFPREAVRMDLLHLTAKTESDLETVHSQRQLLAFLSFLASQHHGILLLAVPWSASAAARNLIASLCRSLDRGAPAVTVLDGVDGEC